MCVWGGGGLANEIRYATKAKAAAEATCTLSETRYGAVLFPCVVSACVHVSAHLPHTVLSAKNILLAKWGHFDRSPQLQRNV